MAGNTKLRTNDTRQVVIPAINFTCNGSVTRWVAGARWKGNSGAFTELQIWRHGVSLNQFFKVSSSVITSDHQKSSELYQLEISLPFQEGDVLGYFQPTSNITPLDLYLEDSVRITTFNTYLASDDLTPPSEFLINAAYEDTKYPLIAVTTGTENLKLPVIMSL